MNIWEGNMFLSVKILRQRYALRSSTESSIAKGSLGVVPQVMGLFSRLGKNTRRLTWFFPYMLVVFVLLAVPYYLISPQLGIDVNYHLARAVEIKQEPLRGLFSDYLTAYPVGRPAVHPPLFHTGLSFLLSAFEPRIAYTVLTFIGFLFTIYVAQRWGLRYGSIAGVGASLLVLATPAPDMLALPAPSTFAIPLSFFSILFFVERRYLLGVLFVTLALWTHPLAVITFPTLLLFRFRDRQLWKSILLAAILSSPAYLSWLIKGLPYLTPVTLAPALAVGFPAWNYPLNLGILLVLAAGGVWLYRREEKVKILLAYLLFSWAFWTFVQIPHRIAQNWTLPLAVLGGLFIERAYRIVKNNFYLLAGIVIAVAVLSVFWVAEAGSKAFSAGIGWHSVNEPYSPYENLANYVVSITQPDEPIYASTTISEVMVWLTGRPVANAYVNGLPPNYEPRHQRVNVFLIFENMPENMRVVFSDEHGRVAVR
jgi:hypothetical protein